MCTKAPSAIHVQCAVCEQNRNAHSKSSSQYVSRIVAESVSGYHYSRGVFNIPVGNVSEVLINLLSSPQRFVCLKGSEGSSVVDRRARDRNWTRVRFPATAAGTVLPHSVLTLIWFLFHPRVTAVAMQQPNSAVSKPHRLIFKNALCKSTVTI